MTSSDRRQLPMRVRMPWLYTTEMLRDAMVTLDDRRNLQQVRAGRPICWDPSEEDTPLVTIRIATYNTGMKVAERALASACSQTYENIEILVIGDNCDAETEAAVRSVDDERIRFLNLPARGTYPDLAHLRRKVAGAHPMNIGVSLASGAWIAPCDDDDVMTPDHVEVLLEAARRGPYEMVWSRVESEQAPGVYDIHGSPELKRGDISHGSVLYRSELRFMQYSLTCWKRREPSDWNMWKRMKRIGVKMGFDEHITYRHHLSQAMRTRLAEESGSAVSEA